MMTSINRGDGRYTSAQNAERALNAAIIRANISESFEEYLDLFDAFYADNVEVTDETSDQTISGKSKVRSLLLNFLVPLHVMAEVGGLSISVEEMTIPGDVAGETHSAWTLHLTAPSGSTCTLSWSVHRKWAGSRVVYERHYDHDQRGGPLRFDDFTFNTVASASERVS
jgi:hypothetical protein